MIQIVLCLTTEYFTVAQSEHFLNPASFSYPPQKWMKFIMWDNKMNKACTLLSNYGPTRLTIKCKNLIILLPKFAHTMIRLKQNFSKFKFSQMHVWNIHFCLSNTQEFYNNSFDLFSLQEYIKFRNVLCNCFCLYSYICPIEIVSVKLNESSLSFKVHFPTLWGWTVHFLDGCPPCCLVSWVNVGNIRRSSVFCDCFLPCFAESPTWILPSNWEI